MSKPILDKAEVAIDFPEKFYHGSFGRDSRFDVKPESDGVVIVLDRKSGEKRHVEFHLHYQLLADMIAAVSEALAVKGDIPQEHVDSLKRATKKLAGIFE